MVSASAGTGEGLPWPDQYADLRPELVKEWDVEGEIYLVRKLSGGKSGALVYVADLSGKGFSGQAILKFDDYPDPASQEANEAERHRQAMESAPDYAAQHLPRIVDTYSHDHQLAILSTIAGGGLEYAEPWVSSAYDEQLATANRLSREILEDWNRDYRLSDGLRTPQELLRGWLGYRIDPQKGRVHSFMREQHGLTADQSSFVFDGTWFPNPLNFANETTDLPDHLRLRAVVGNLHGDLHGQNVLVTRQPDRNRGYYLIDLALFEPDGYLFYDHAYFELTYLLRSRDRANAENWLSILDSAGRVGQGGTVRQGDDLGLVQLIASVRRELFQWVDRHEANRLSHMESQALLARVAVGTCFAHRRLSVESRSMAFLYAAKNLKELLEHNGIDWPKYGPSISIDPGTTATPRREASSPPPKAMKPVAGETHDAADPANPEDAAEVLDKPAIAVLAFENQSDDPDQDYFANGITEDLVTDLSRVDWLTVIAQEATRAYKDSATDVRNLREVLGARYVVSGSVRKSNDRIRVTAHLVDTQSQTEIWGDRFDRQTEDLFALQDEIAARIVANIDAEAKSNQRELAARKHGPLDAWELYQKALWHFFKATPEDDSAAVKEIHSAIREAPEFGGVRAMLAMVEIRRAVLGICSDPERELRLAADNARRAVELDADSALAHMVYAGSLLLKGDRDAAVTEAEVAVRLNPSGANGYFALCCAYYWNGRIVEALTALDRAIDSNPRERLRVGISVIQALCTLESGDLPLAEKAARQAIVSASGAALPYLALAIVCVRSNRLEEARAAVRDARDARPDYGYAEFELVFRHVVPAQRDRILEDLSTAGFAH